MIICLHNSDPIEPPAPVIRILSFLIPSLSNNGSGKTFSLPSKSSINKLLFDLIVNFFEIISTIDGIVRIGIFSGSKLLLIWFFFVSDIEDIAISILSILDLLLNISLGYLIGIPQKVIY